MEAYRDQYATLFNNGRRVTVIGISADPDTALASWARDSDFPMLFATDADGAVARRYGVADAQNRLGTRALYVVDPEGVVRYSVPAFKPLVPSAYTELAAVVDRLAPPEDEEGTP
jgi:peroxiredoxin Q/BCP